MLEAKPILVKNLKKISSVSILALILVLSAGNLVHAEVTSMIPLGTLPQGLAYDSAKGEIFVANPAVNAVSVISDSTNVVITTINVGSDPSEVAYDSGKGEIFVTNGLGRSVSVILDSNNTVVATVTVGNDPQGMVYDFGKGEMFVTNAADNTVSVISDSSNAVVATVDMVPQPNLDSSLTQAYSAAYDPEKGEIYGSYNRFTDGLSHKR